jgi:hypothetical protein
MGCDQVDLLPPPGFTARGVGVSSVERSETSTLLGEADRGETRSMIAGHED